MYVTIGEKVKLSLCLCTVIVTARPAHATRRYAAHRQRCRIWRMYYYEEAQAQRRAVVRSRARLSREWTYF